MNMTRKEFRNYLNEKFPANPATNHKHNRYQQRTRAYGDYLWHQDRSMFEADYQEHLVKLEKAAA
jgi:hypothetical protein